jgi:ketol-acid reductoisomerase
MRAVLDEVRSGHFAEALRQEALGGYPKLENARDEARKRPIERVFRELSNLGEA